MKASEIKVGVKFEITSTVKRNDGFVNKQVVVAEIVEVNKSYFKWKTVKVVEASTTENALTGGMSMFSKLEWLFTKGGYKAI
jgi:hypothetical protein